MQNAMIAPYAHGAVIAYTIGTQPASHFIVSLHQPSECLIPHISQRVLRFKLWKLYLGNSSRTLVCCCLLQAVSGEEDNMILIHCWEEEEPEDMHLKCVVDILLAMYQDLSEDVDVREQSSEVSEALKVTVAAKIAEHVFGSGGQGSADGVHPALQKSSGLLHVFEDAHGNAAEVELTVSG